MTKSIIKAWQGRIGENVEIGSQLVITDKLKKRIDSKLIDSMEGILASALANKLISDSLIPESLVIEKERDESVRLWELYVSIDTVLKPTLLPLTMKMDGLLRHALKVMKMKRISLKRKQEWLDELSEITGDRYSEESDGSN